jgi:hypoxanthine phosphoribosyltransferase
MDTNIIAGVIAAIATVIAALIGVIANRRKNEEKNQNEQKLSKIEGGTFIKEKESPENNRIDISKVDAEKYSVSIQEQKTFELGGVIHVLRERLRQRVIEQLDSSSRIYETYEAVEAACKKLAQKVQTSNFYPEIVIGWKDSEDEYRGSQTIARLLSQELGLPFRILLLKETSEKREVVESCQWFQNISKALVVDDACYSGNTLLTIETRLTAENKNADIRFAVLSKKDSIKLPKLFYTSVHKTEELLFPWGWSRLIVGLYDIYSYFGTSDRHTVWRESTIWGTSHILAKKFLGNVKLLVIKPKGEFLQEENREFDSFLYIISGQVQIKIGNKSKSFMPEQYIFIPGDIAYKIRTQENEVHILQLLSTKKL